MHLPHHASSSCQPQSLTACHQKHRPRKRQKRTHRPRHQTQRMGPPPPKTQRATPPRMRPRACRRLAALQRQQLSLTEAMPPTSQTTPLFPRGHLMPMTTRHLDPLPQHCRHCSSSGRQACSPPGIPTLLLLPRFLRCHFRPQSLAPGFPPYHLALSSPRWPRHWLHWHLRCALLRLGSSGSRSIPLRWVLQQSTSSPQMSRPSLRTHTARCIRLPSGLKLPRRLPRRLHMSEHRPPRPHKHHQWRQPRRCRLHASWVHQPHRDPAHHRKQRPPTVRRQR